MAGGQDHSVNLSGMFDGIQTSLQKMGETGGMFADSFANALKPQIDPSSPESYQKAAEWASNNSRPEEAKQYRDEATRISLANTKAEVAKKEEDVTKQLRDLQIDYSQAMQSGDVAKMREIQSKTTTLSQATTGVSQSLTEKLAESATKMADGYGEGQKNHDSNQVNHAVQTLAKLSDPDFVASMPGGEKSAAEVRKRIQSTVDTYNGEQSELFNTQVTAQIDARASAKEAEALGKEAEAERQLKEAFNKPGSTSKSLAALAGKLGQPEIAKPWIALAETREKTGGKSPAQAVPFNLELVENSWKDLQALRPDGTESEEWYAELQSNLAILRTEAKNGGSVAGPAALNSRLNALTTRMLNEISGLKSQDRQDERALSRAQIDDLEEIEKHSPTKNDKQLLAHMSSEANTSWLSGGHAIDPLEFGPLSRDVLRVEKGYEPVTFVIDKEGRPVFNSDGTPQYLDSNAEKLTSRSVEQDVYGSRRTSKFKSQPDSAASTPTTPTVDTEAVAQQIEQAVPQRDKIPMPRSISSKPELLAQFPDWDDLPVERQLYFQKKYDALLRE